MDEKVLVKHDCRILGFRWLIQLFKISAVSGSAPPPKRGGKKKKKKKKKPLSRRFPAIAKSSGSIR